MLENQFNPIEALQYIQRGFEINCFDMGFYQSILTKFPKKQIMNVLANCRQNFINKFEGPVKEQAKIFISQFSPDFINKIKRDYIETKLVKKKVKEFCQRYEKNLAKAKQIKKYTCDVCKKYYTSDNGLYNHKKKIRHFVCKDNNTNSKKSQMPKLPASKKRSSRKSN